MNLLVDAAEHRRHFNVVVTEGRPGNAGEMVIKMLLSSNT